MERKVTIDDPAIDTLVEAVAGLTRHVENLFEEVRRHRHFMNDPENARGGEWTNLNDAFAAIDFDATLEGLKDIRIEVEGLKPS